MSFEGSGALQEPVAVERLGTDFVVGVRGPIGEADIDLVYERVEEIARILVETHGQAESEAAI